MRKTRLPILLLLTMGPIAWSQTFDKIKLDGYFDALEKNNQFMGSVAVSKNGKNLYTRSIGYADVQRNLKATKNSKYRIGSISKSFTAVLILKAVEEEKIALDQPVDTWFPTITNAKKITVKQLLSHRSGLHNFTDNKDYLTWNSQPKTEKEMVDIIAKGGSNFEPGSKAAYSNSNFVLLSYILEKTFSKSYSDLVQQYIVNPIGLENTYVFGNIHPNNNECTSYTYSGTWKVEKETDYTIPLGAGAITSTPIDLTKFSEALFGGKLLNPETLDIMKTIKDGYGMGLFQIPFYSRIGYGHTGGIDGFTAVYSYFEEDKIAYALTSNGTNTNNNAISVAVLSAVFNKPYEIPVVTTYDVASEDLDKYLGVYAADQIALKITITKQGNILIAQGTGQPAFSLEATEKHKFRLDRVGARFEFDPTEKTMVLFQGGGKVEFRKE